ncbi:lasso peptide biosynthesis PqqD family chaperone [Streptomyces sp. A244]|uniref:lasso peptide biosynthesis PqqD family chaperone n=1 Tax=Streptomyces TaxID=1883 RepID=UPI000D1ACF1D|nr:lasso peptide biosynthesis PqqD family chaperone [Streptomyces sp. A244]PTH90236.1 lasso peptide biosynthesis PqqD family chaperone [Streptomyces sp. A244]
MTLTLPPDVTTADTEDGLVLLDQRNGRYWQLNRTGAAMLRLLLEGLSPEQAAARLAASTPVAADRALADVRALIESLTSAHLVVTS